LLISPLSAVGPAHEDNDTSREATNDHLPDDLHQHLQGVLLRGVASQAQSYLTTDLTVFTPVVSASRNN
jgi:hypothetical protein